MRTNDGKVHETGGYNNPEVRSVDDVAPIDLEREALGTQASGHSSEQRTDQ